MDPRFDRAHGAMAGLFYGQALEVDATVDKGSQSAPLSESILSLMAATESTKQPTFPCFTTPVDHLYGLMLGAVQLGIATSISNPQAFADAVWDNSQKREPAPGLPGDGAGCRRGVDRPRQSELPRGGRSRASRQRRIVGGASRRVKP